MSWLEIDDLSLVFYAVIGFMGLLALVLWRSGVWLAQVERRQVRDYVESHGAELLSIEKLGPYPANGMFQHRGPNPVRLWHEQGDAPTYRVVWRDRYGVEGSAELKTHAYRRSVWSDAPFHDHSDIPSDVLALEAENSRLRRESAARRAERRRRRPDQEQMDHESPWGI